MAPVALSSCIRSFSDQDSIISALTDLTPVELGRATTQIRATMAAQSFDEVVLSPFTALPIRFKNEVIDVTEMGQLRFNTEPEIWEASHQLERFFSMSSLFRREEHINVLRRPSFQIVDFYHHATSESLIDVFRAVLSDLADAGFTERVANLPFEKAEYDAEIDGPVIDSSGYRWVITSGYDAAHSFYEADIDGKSNRRELFLATPHGYLEVGVLGRTGWNRNPEYHQLTNEATICPDLDRSGMCFGLERLLFAERILSLIDP